MKFYDLEWLAEKCGTDNKYEITVKVAAEARRESEEAQIDKDNGNERYISNVLLEIEEDRSPINACNSEKSEAEFLDPFEAPEAPEALEEPEQSQPEIVAMSDE